MSAYRQHEDRGGGCQALSPSIPWWRKLFSKWRAILDNLFPISVEKRLLKEIHQEKTWVLISEDGSHSSYLSLADAKLKIRSGDIVAIPRLGATSGTHRYYVSKWFK